MDEDESTVSPSETLTTPAEDALAFLLANDLQLVWCGSLESEVTHQDVVLVDSDSLLDNDSNYDIRPKIARVASKWENSNSGSGGLVAKS
ncbi:hypothetical protein AVEN_158257-1 [Araneus ventricosus]|uniref:Uncharacterized protein n=1 Tax=Araneus ventricosus TaxID=182803 RepID=A0A4Y2G4Q7_ARAVE|nr:hypothetical protein AVEN_158257-1 [Araneus ventricosus]